MYLLFEAFLLVIALSLDTFTASLAFGIDRIKVPFWSAVIINLICSGLLLFSLLCGSMIHTYIAPDSKVTIYISFGILFIMGIIRLLDAPLKRFIRRIEIKSSDETNGFCRFILAIYADSQKADVNRSKSISISEAVTLSVALSIDSLAAGLGAGLDEVNVLLTFAMAFVMGMLAVLGGYLLGKKLSAVISMDLSWVGGVMLILLAGMRLL